MLNAIAVLILVTSAWRTPHRLDAQREVAILKATENKVAQPFGLHPGEGTPRRINAVVPNSAAQNSAPTTAHRAPLYRPAHNGPDPLYNRRGRRCTSAIGATVERLLVAESGLIFLKPVGHPSLGLIVAVVTASVRLKSCATTQPPITAAYAA